MKRIMVGVDGSPESLEAVRWTAELAGHLDAEVVAATVFGLHSTVVSFEGAYYMPAEVVEQWRKELRDNLEGPWTQALRDAGVRVVTSMEEGRASEVLLRLARERSVDLVVVGSRSHGAVREMFLGSVSHALALHAPCPVVVMPHRHEGEAGEA